jgi:hypothetical protein
MTFAEHRFATSSSLNLFFKIAVAPPRCLTSQGYSLHWMHLMNDHGLSEIRERVVLGTCVVVAGCDDGLVALFRCTHAGLLRPT